MTAETWVSTVLAAALFVGLVVLTLAGRDGSKESHGRHAAPPVCHCDCHGRRRERSNLLPYIPPQPRRPL